MKKFIIFIFMIMGSMSFLRSMEMEHGHQEKNSTSEEIPVIATVSLPPAQENDGYTLYDEKLSELEAVLGFDGCEGLDKWVMNKRRATYQWVKNLHEFLQKLSNFGPRGNDKERLAKKIENFQQAILTQITQVIDNGKTKRPHAIRKQIGPDIPAINQLLNTIGNNEFNAEYNASRPQPELIADYNPLLPTLANAMANAVEVTPENILSGTTLFNEKTVEVPVVQEEVQAIQSAELPNNQNDNPNGEVTFQELLNNDNPNDEVALNHRRSPRKEEVQRSLVSTQVNDQTQNQIPTITQNPIAAAAPVIGAPVVQQPAQTDSFFGRIKQSMATFTQFIQAPQAKSFVGMGAGLALLAAGIYKLSKRDTVAQLNEQKLDSIIDFLKNKQEGVPFNDEQFNAMPESLNLLNKSTKDSAQQNIAQLIAYLNGRQEGTPFGSELFDRLASSIHLLIDAHAIAEYNKRRIDTLINYISNQTSGKQYYSDEYCALVHNIFLLTHHDEHSVLYEYAQLGNRDYQFGDQNITVYLEDIKSEMLERAQNELDFFKKAAREGKVTRLKAYLEDIKAEVVDKLVPELEFIKNCAARGNVARLQEFIENVKKQLPERAKELSLPVVVGKNINGTWQNAKEAITNLFVVDEHEGSLA